MAVTVATLVQLTRQRLHEATNSVVGEMATGSGGTATVSATNGIIEALNRVAQEICSTCHYYEATGSISTTGQTFPLATLTVSSPTNAEIFLPLWVAQGAGLTALQFVTRGTLSPSTYLSAAAGTPLYWLDESVGGIEIFPKPASSTLITIRGASYPPPMTSGGADQNWMNDAELQKMLPAGAAARLAMAEVDNPALAARGPLWQAEYDAERARIWGLVPAQVRNRCFPTQPGVM